MCLEGLGLIDVFIVLICELCVYVDIMNFAGYGLVHMIFRVMLLNLTLKLVIFGFKFKELVLRFFQLQFELIVGLCEISLEVFCISERVVFVFLCVCLCELMLLFEFVFECLVFLS